MPSAGTAPSERGRASARRLVRRAARRVFGPALGSHYVPALRARRRTVRYDAKRAWARRYERLLEEGELDDAATIKRGANPLGVRYHYNAVENAVLEHALARGFPTRPTVLDVGAGSGHWIAFYREAFDASEVVAVEIASPAAKALEAAYATTPEVAVVEADITDERFRLDRRFDVVSAVDVLFHVVDDAAWRRTVARLGAHLSPGGRMVVAEHVSLVSHDAGFRRPISELGEDGGPATTVVTKRIRSARAWRRCAHDAGLRVVDALPIRKSRLRPTPANRVIVLARAPSPARARHAA